MNMAFTGSKLAILTSGCVVSILRDDVAGIPFPGWWDLPGGGREKDESPLDCALRETREELSIGIDLDHIHWGACFGSDEQRTWFFVARVQSELIGRIVLGDEGQKWDAMPIDRFLSHDRVVPHFQTRLRQYLCFSEDQEKPPASWSGGR
jgi:8-oxo-dGTP diphosphatase